MYCDKCIGMLCLLVQADLSVPDVPKTIAWCQDSLCVGFKRDYYLIKVCHLFFSCQCLFWSFTLWTIIVKQCVLDTKL